MRLHLLAVARERKADVLSGVAADYLSRAAALAPGLGLRGPEARWVSPSRDHNPAREAEALATSISAGAVLLDERGAMLASEDIAALIAARRDGGARELSFCIGGANGFDPALRKRVVAEGGTLLAFGRAVWPHALCRAMMAEQLYRALAILAGHPYHRGA